MRWIVTVGVVAWLAGCGGGHVGNNIDAGPEIDASALVCDGLDLATCRTTAGCVADICSGCACEQTYEQCRRESDEPFECPPLLCPAPTCCGDVADCDPGDQCLRPGETPPCAIPNPDPGDCTSDVDCTANPNDICVLIPCSETGAQHCVPGCTSNDDCDTGTECNPEHRCTSQPCDDQNPCPTDFHCDEAFCARDTCTLDADCSGFCVDGLCYDGLGTCAAPPP